MSLTEDGRGYEARCFGGRGNTFKGREEQMCLYIKVINRELIRNITVVSNKCT